MYQVNIVIRHGRWDKTDQKLIQNLESFFEALEEAGIHIVNFEEVNEAVITIKEQIVDWDV